MRRIIQKKFTKEEYDLIENHNIFNGYKYGRKQTAFLARSKFIADHTREEWLYLCAGYDFKCCKCGCDVIGGIPTKDHIIPIRMGGTSHIDNLQPLCRQCNLSKGNNIIDYRK
jgi:5-methylcytosine-specific restriction endonuclease McrA